MMKMMALQPSSLQQQVVKFDDGSSSDDEEPPIAVKRKQRLVKKKKERRVVIIESDSGSDSELGTNQPSIPRYHGGCFCFFPLAPGSWNPHLLSEAAAEFF
jgi:hypothetical protein